MVDINFIHVDGYYMVTESGYKAKINKYGFVVWVDGLFDKYDDLLDDLIGTNFN